MRAASEPIGTLWARAHSVPIAGLKRSEKRIVCDHTGEERWWFQLYVITDFFQLWEHSAGERALLH